MRGRSSKQESKQGMELDKLNKLKEEPHLSGAYIRNLVKQLTSSRTKDTMNHPKDRSFVNEDGCSGQDMTICDQGLSKNQPTQLPQQPQPHKKQVRRRLHTSRPYQERLLNMAEARREIVAALKFHRATMKEHQQQQQQQQQQQHEPQHHQQQQPSLPLHLSPSSCFEQEGKIKSRRNPRIYPSNTSNCSNYLDSLSYTSFGPHAPLPPTSPPSYPYYWPNPPILPSTVTENLNFPLPNQTLGLNLNFQDFNNLDATLYHSSNNPSSVYKSSSPSSFSSSSPSLSIATEEVAKFQEAGMPSMAADLAETYGGGGLHQVMDDEEMAEIRSIGEQHQMEWSDTMNLVTSAWWFKFLKTMESDPEVQAEDDGYNHPFEQVMEFPAWLNANEGCLQQHLDDYCSQDYYHDPTLPCMDIGEIEGMDGEWLA
ncbi:uncharacterized protein [Euphorbia lathyris]|uniref:uncharacterized protein n=1 Tax=Euphorbia lathyris TaxID=212925 RepID=UPI00331318C7